MTGMRLYAEALAIIASLDCPEGADPDALAPELAAWLDECDDKIGAYAAVLARLDIEANVIKAALDDYDRARARIAVQRERVRDLVQLMLESREALGEDPKVKRPGFSAYFLASERVDVPNDPDDYPERFHVVTVRPDKAAIKAAIKAGEDVPGCSLVSGRSLVVRT